MTDTRKATYCPASNREFNGNLEPGEYDQCPECGRMITVDRHYNAKPHTTPTQEWQYLYRSRADAEFDGFFDRGEQ